MKSRRKVMQLTRYENYNFVKFSIMADNNNNNNNNNNNDDDNKNKKKFIMYAFCPQSFQWTAFLEKAATRQCHFVPRTSLNFKAVTSLATCSLQTRVQLSSLPSKINFCFFVTTWFNYQNDIPALCDLHKQLCFVYFITTKPNSFVLVTYLCTAS